jgi:hypothetical protein
MGVFLLISILYLKMIFFIEFKNQRVEKSYSVF